MGGIEDAFDLFQPDAGVFDIMAHAVGVGLEGFNGVFRVSSFESEIIFKKVVVRVHVGDGEDLQGQAVIAHEIGDGGIRIDHHLVREAAETVVVQGFEFLEPLAVGPVGIVRGHAGIDHVREHLVVVAHLEFLGIGIESVLFHQLDDTLVPLLKVFDGILRRHGGSGYAASSRTRSLARKVLKEAHISSLRWICTVRKLGS